MSDEKHAKKKIEKVVTGAVTTKKKSGLQKFTNSIISEDVPDIKSYIIGDIVVPMIKDGIEDLVHLLLRGETGHSKKPLGSRISYGSCFGSGNKSQKEREARSVRTGFEYDDVIFANRGDAEAVLYAMDDIIDQFGTVSVGDFYDMAEVSTNNYMVNKYGWTDLRGATIGHVRGGFIIKFPKPMPLN